MRFILARFLLNMKILFLLGMYYPKYSANGLCCKNVIDECVRCGLEVICIVNSYNGNKSDFELDGAKIYPIKPRITYRLMEWCEGHPKSKLKRIIILFSNIVNKIQLALGYFSWPYISPLYTRSFLKKAEYLHKKQAFDAVISVYTPIDSLYAGYKLKSKFSNLIYIPYYLDALAGGWGPNQWSVKKKERRLRFWEKRIANKADAIFSMESSKAYHTQFPLPNNINEKRFYLDVPMMLPSIANKTKRGLKKYALFAGDLSYPRRDPIPLMEVFAPICKDLNIDLYLVGPYNIQSIFTPYIEATGGRIHLLGKRAHEEVVELEQNAEFLVNIGSANPNVIPCKIFEYMRFRKPILSTFSIDNEPSIPYLKKYGCVHFIDERISYAESSNALKSFILQADKMCFSDDYCQNLFYLNTPKAFVDTLKKVMEEKR